MVMAVLTLMLYYLVMTTCRIRVTKYSDKEECVWRQLMAAVLNTKESESNLHQSPVSSVLLINYQQSPGTGSSVLRAVFCPFFASPWAAVISGYRSCTLR